MRLVRSAGERRKLWQKSAASVILSPEVEQHPEFRPLVVRLKGQLAQRRLPEAPRPNPDPPPAA